MMHFFKCGRGTLCVVLLHLLCVSSAVSAQDYSQQRKQFLDQLDLSGLGNTLFLNAALTNQHETEFFKKRFKASNPAVEKVAAEEWQNLYERLVDADLRTGNQRIPDFAKLTETDAYKVTRNNLIPIGIIDLSSIYFTVTDIDENKAAKRAGEKVDFRKYEKFDVTYAAVLQDEVYQSDVSFKISPELYISNQNKKPSHVEIDFGDGRGFITYPISENAIPHRFEKLGKHTIHIRFEGSGNTYLFDTEINVRQLERTKPFAEFQVEAPRIFKDSLVINPSARTALAGGNVRIILGCDQILDKPIIIAEGFDMGQDVTLDNIEAKYMEALRQYLTEGYDLVLLDYHDARTAIQDNAQVLKALIQEVNQMKTGNAGAVVIGESMSGLVARWALKQMENEGIPHHVSLMICYDTPHQGANVPVGLTQLAWEAAPTILTQVILKFFAKGWRTYYQALGTTAAQQLFQEPAGRLRKWWVSGKLPEYRDNPWKYECQRSEPV